MNAFDLDALEIYRTQQDRQNGKEMTEKEKAALTPQKLEQLLRKAIWRVDFSKVDSRNLNLFFGEFIEIEEGE